MKQTKLNGVVEFTLVSTLLSAALHNARRLMSFAKRHDIGLIKHHFHLYCYGLIAGMNFKNYLLNSGYLLSVNAAEQVFAQPVFFSESV